MRGIPHWLGNIWMRYNFVQEKQRTLGMAIGMRYVGSRLGDYSFAADRCRPTTSGTWASTGTRIGWSASLLWDNIFNVNYAATSLSQYQVIPGTPSNVRLQFSAFF